MTPERPHKQSPPSPRFSGGRIFSTLTCAEDEVPVRNCLPAHSGSSQVFFFLAPSGRLFWKWRLMLHRIREINATGSSLRRVSVT